MARKIIVHGTNGITSYKSDGTVWSSKSKASLNSASSEHFPSSSAMTLDQISLDVAATKMEIRNTGGVKLTGLQTPETTDGTAITIISNASVPAAYAGAFSNVQTGTTSLPPSSSENRTWAFKYTCSFEGTCRIRGNGAPTGSLVSGNDRAIYILVNGTQVAARGSSTSGSNWAEKTNQTIAEGDVVQYDIRDVYWRYSSSGIAAQNCEIRVGTYD